MYNMYNNKYKGFSKYSSSGLREEWLDDLFDKGSDWLDNNSLKISQMKSMLKWLKDAELIDKGKYVTNMFSNLKNVYKNKKDAVLEILWINLYFNSAIIKWYINELPFGYYYNRDNLVEIILRNCNNGSKSSISCGLQALLNLLEKSSYGQKMKLGIIERRYYVRYVGKMGCDKIDPLSLCYYLYKVAEIENKKRFNISDFKTNSDFSKIDDLIKDYNSSAKNEFYSPFGLSKDTFSELLYSLQSEYELVNIISEPNIEIILKDEINSEDIILRFANNQDNFELCITNVNIQDEKGETPIHIYCVNGKLQAIKFLIEEKGVDVNIKNKWGTTPLHKACYYGHLDIVKLLIKNGADPNIKNKDGDTPLSIAQKKEYSDIVKFLVENKKSNNNKLVNNIKSKKDEDPLIEAVKNKKLKKIKLLVKNGANVNIKKGKTSLLHFACYSENFNIVKFLLENGADPNTKDKDGDTPLHIVCYNDKFFIAKFLLENGADPNIQNKDGDTPLHIACYNLYLKIIEILEENGANINIKNRLGNTPASIIENNIEKATNYLETCSDKNSKFSVDEEDIDFTEFVSEEEYFTAAADGNMNIIKISVLFNADLDLKDENGETPLHYACSNGHLNIVKFLIRKGANVNIKSDYGETPLYDACSNGYLNIVKFLIKKGANVNIKNNDNATILHIACEWGHFNIVNYLIEEEGLNINDKDNYEQTPLCLAIKNLDKEKQSNNKKKYEKIIEYLKEKDTHKM